MQTQSSVYEKPMCAIIATNLFHCQKKNQKFLNTTRPILNFTEQTTTHISDLEVQRCQTQLLDHANIKVKMFGKQDHQQSIGHSRLRYKTRHITGQACAEISRHLLITSSRL